MDNKEKQIIITGAAGFIGSHLIEYLSRHDKWREFYIHAVDNLEDGRKFKRLKNGLIDQYLDYTELFEHISLSEYPIEMVVHLGACSNTQEWNGQKILSQNYNYSQALLNECIANNVPFIYASSASVYGNKKDDFDPLNLYAWSKMMFDKLVVQIWKDDLKETLSQLPPIVGLRFFNVFGPNEDLKYEQKQSSPVYSFWKDIKDGKAIEIFEGGAQRDFVFVEDVCSVVEYMMNNFEAHYPHISGIFDVGSGQSKTFKEVAQILIEKMPEPDSGYPVIQMAKFPEHLKDRYQFHTQANLEPLRQSGYDKPFLSLEEGIQQFLKEVSE